MSNTTAEQRRGEAIERLRILQAKGLHENVLADFGRRGRINYSEWTPLTSSFAMGTLFWADNDTAVSDDGRPFSNIIRKFEEENDATVYHATHEYTNFGEILDLFYVSDYTEEWQQDRDDLVEGRAFVRAINLSDGCLSDYGTIGFSVSGGGLVRTA